jgi:hypothetical protein
VGTYLVFEFELCKHVELDEADAFGGPELAVRCLLVLVPALVHLHLQILGQSRGDLAHRLLEILLTSDELVDLPSEDFVFLDKRQDLILKEFVDLLVDGLVWIIEEVTNAFGRCEQTHQGLL